MRDLLRLPSCLLVALALLSAAPAAHARADAPEAATARLGYLSPRERALLSPELDQGPIALVEFAEDTELPALVVATRVQAPAARVVDIVRQVQDYPRFMPALDEVHVQGHHGPTTSYEWVWRTAVFTLKGANVMTEYPAPPSRSDRPYAFGVRSVKGDLGAGRFMWQVYPEDDGHCLLLLASRLDMRDANWVAEQLSSGGNGVNRTINLSLAFLMLLSTKAQAEGGALHFPPKPAHQPFLHVHRLYGLLRRGDLVFLDMQGGHLNDVRVVGRMGRTEGIVRAVVDNPENFGGALLHGSRATVVSRDDRGVTFDWEIPLPLVGSSGRMRLSNRPNGVIAVDAVSGGLQGGRWRFAIHDFPGDAVVVGWASFDPAKTSWLIERLVNGVPFFREGLTAASQIMVIRSIRTQVRDYDPRTAAK